MRTAKETLDQYFLEMRWRCLSLAADLDRVSRLPDGDALLAADPRVQKLHRALTVLQQNHAGRAEAVQNIFSDMTPPVTRTPR